ncbi:MAG: hypothetical protein CM1200mP13_11450 [Candidatus Pelagibacterales bacterium]|nr:MAG: hypothetical protein CM1200mP13_11450 [Pelagibacterales bacterium]
MKKLLVIFVLCLLNIILVNCSEKETKIKIEKVLLFGDSLMSGYGLPDEQHLSVVLEENLKLKVTTSKLLMVASQETLL